MRATSSWAAGAVPALAPSAQSTAVRRAHAARRAERRRTTSSPRPTPTTPSSRVNESNNVAVPGPSPSARTWSCRPRRPRRRGARRAGGTTFTVTDVTRNASAGPRARLGHALLSVERTTVLDAGDVVLGSRAVPALGPYTESSAVTALTLPAGLGAAPTTSSPGPTPTTRSPEVNETNNVCVCSRALSSGTDLVVFLDVPAASLQARPAPHQRHGRHPERQPRPGARLGHSLLSLERTGVLDASDLVLGSRAVPALAPSTESTAVTSLTLPTGLIGGAYYVIARADADNAVIGDERDQQRVRLRPADQPRRRPVRLPRPGRRVVRRRGRCHDHAARLHEERRARGPAPASTVLFYLSRDTVLDAATR